MNTDPHDLPFRSPHLMNVHDSALVIIDFQEKLVPKISGFQRIEWNLQRLINAANILRVPIRVTEQYPQGLGKTVSTILDVLGSVPTDPIPAKTMFSCRECIREFASLKAQGVYKILLSGIETHVCVAQTAFDLMADGFSVYLALDAIGSRGQLDHETAIRRMENAGAIPTTTEAALFEWCEKAGSESFKQISQLVRQSPPS